MNSNRPYSYPFSFQMVDLHEGNYYFEWIVRAISRAPKMSGDALRDSLKCETFHKLYAILYFLHNVL